MKYLTIYFVKDDFFQINPEKHPIRMLGWSISIALVLTFRRDYLTIKEHNSFLLERERAKSRMYIAAIA